MPPKADAGAGNENFLVTCIKCAKAKLEVDFGAVAKAAGMSKGGASNKFRTLMKQFEDEGAMWAQAGTGNGSIGENLAPKRKGPPKKAAAKSDIKVEDDEGSATEERPPTTKAKAKAALKKKKKGTATAKETKITKDSASEGDGEEETVATSEAEE